MTEKINMTMAAIERLQPLQTDRRWVYDTKVSGLVLLVTAAGAKSFYVYKKVSGRPVRFNLGKFPTMTVDDARDHATKYLANLADGLDPAAAKRKQRGELTLGGLWTLFLEFHSEPHKKPRSVKEDRGMWNRYLIQWQNRKLSAIGYHDVHAWHAKIGKENGKVAANRVLAMLSKMFTVARDHGEWRMKPNPCDGIKHFAEKSRDRFLQPDELPRFFKALDEEPNQQAADAFRLMLFTGARKTNVLSMAWKDVDLDSSIWRIPDTKQGEPHRVPLMKEAVDILKKLKASAQDGAYYVFPGRYAGSKFGYLTDVAKIWASIITRAETPQLRTHDLRRTMASYQAIGGSSLQVIGKSLGHKSAVSTEIYARLILEPVVKSMEKATKAMTAAGKPAKKSRGEK